MDEGVSRGPLLDRDLEFRRLQEEINRVFSNRYTEHFDYYDYPARSTFALRADIYENENEMLIEIDLPGLEAGDFELTLTGNDLTLRGERRGRVQAGENVYLLRECGHGAFARSFRLPDFVSAESATAQFRNGVLRITLPKRVEVKARRIEIKGEPFSGSRVVEAGSAPAGRDEEDVGFIEEMTNYLEGLERSDHENAEGDEAGEATANAASTPLYINIWIEEADGRAVTEPFRVAAHLLYKFVFGIEPWARSETARPFEVPDALKEALKGRQTVEIELEVACPFLEEKGRTGYARRKIVYYDGFGFLEPASFLLRPKTEGEYFLSVCLLLGLEPLYSDTLTIEVVPPPNALREEAKEAAELITTGEQR